MPDMMQPVAVSGVDKADKIRSVIFTNNHLAHVPLPEILNLVFETDKNSPPQAQKLNDGKQKINETQEHTRGQKNSQAQTNEQAHFIRLGANLLIQYGYTIFENAMLQTEVDGHNSAAQPRCHVNFLKPYSTSNYYIFVSANANKSTNTASAFTMDDSITKTGFDIGYMPLSAASIKGVFWLSIGCEA